MSLEEGVNEFNYVHNTLHGHTGQTWQRSPVTSDCKVETTVLYLGLVFSILLWSVQCLPLSS